MPRHHMTADGPVPFTPEEEAEWDVKEAATRLQQEKNAYQVARQAEYPPITDYLDGIVKGDQAQVQAYIDACLAVKEKYPKHDAS